MNLKKIRKRYGHSQMKDSELIAIGYGEAVHKIWDAVVRKRQQQRKTNASSQRCNDSGVTRSARLPLSAH